MGRQDERSHGRTDRRNWSSGAVFGHVLRYRVKRSHWAGLRRGCWSWPGRRLGRAPGRGRPTCPHARPEGLSASAARRPASARRVPPRPQDACWRGLTLPPQLSSTLPLHIYFLVYFPTYFSTISRKSDLPVQYCVLLGRYEAQRVGVVTEYRKMPPHFVLGTTSTGQVSADFATACFVWPHICTGPISWDPTLMDEPHCRNPFHGTQILLKSISWTLFWDTGYGTPFFGPYVRDPML